MSFADARKILLNDAAAEADILRAIVVVAESGDADAEGVLKAFFGNEKVMARLDVQVPNGDVLRNPLNEVLAAVAGSDSSIVERLLVDVLDGVPTFGHASPDRNYGRNAARLSCLRHLRKPTSITLDYLAKIAVPGAPHSEGAVYVLLSIDQPQSRTILLQYGIRKYKESPKRDDKILFFKYMVAQRRYEPSCFCVLADGYLALHDQELLELLLEEGRPEKDAGFFRIPEYSEVSPASAQRFMDKLDAFEKGLRRGELTAAQEDRIKTMRRTFEALKATSAGEGGARIGEGGKIVKDE
jgi:hypothetical protein